ncbi:hypothetical protein [Flavobacterium ginsengiterrae]|uniref:Uncharacterized protein n=1 Tax=Flavobacterium ginsengiterrae TaxID=871695 RepID=A0ABP7GSP7_9FLAO
MKLNHTEQTAKIFELINKGKDFKKLKPDNNERNSFTVPLKVSGYNELNLMVTELLKASIILLNKETRSMSVVKDDVNVMTLLEIALQLLPEEEMELLDDLHQFYLQSDK